MQMEDMFHFYQMPKTKFNWFGIYDGHAGCRAAQVRLFFEKVVVQLLFWYLQWLCDNLAPSVEASISSVDSG
jgi:hypothetical protein